MRCRIDNLPHLSSLKATAPRRTAHASRPLQVTFLTSSSTTSSLDPSSFPLMFVLEEPTSRKRRRTSQEPTDIAQLPGAKKQKSTSKNYVQCHHRPPSFWDTLSKVRLSRSALKEFDRRNIQETGQPCAEPIPITKVSAQRARQQLKRFARRGGPDLSHLRGVSLSYVMGIRRLTRASLPAYLQRSPWQ